MDRATLHKIFEKAFNHQELDRSAAICFWSKTIVCTTQTYSTMISYIFIKKIISDFPAFPSSFYPGQIHVSIPIAGGRRCRRCSAAIRRLFFGGNPAGKKG